jgi:hypothetical protein
MKKLIAITIAALAAGCSYNEDKPYFTPTQGPALEWQKQSAALERGRYEATEAIPKETMKQIVESTCQQKPELDSRIRAGSRIVRFHENQFEENGVIAQSIEDLNVTEVSGNRYLGDMITWAIKLGDSRASRRYTGWKFEKNPYSGYYFLDIAYSSRPGSAVTHFPLIINSHIYKEMVEKLNAAEEGGGEFTIGKFTFGNGEIRKAAQITRWTVGAHGKILMSDVYLPLAGDVWTAGCAPDKAYSLVLIMRDGEVTWRNQREALLTTVE